MESNAKNLWVRDFIEMFCDSMFQLCGVKKEKNGGNGEWAGRK